MSIEQSESRFMKYINPNKFVKIASFLFVFNAVSCGNFNNFDFDLRGNEYDTSDAVKKAMQTRPLPDNRGIISYPTYEVAVAQRGDTINSISDRLGLDARDLASYNGMSSREKLNEGQLISLPNRIGEKNNLKKPTNLDSRQVNVRELASTAIENATDRKNKPIINTPKSENEPIRHKVSRGETAFTISRLYNVSIRSLAEWNGLDSNFTIREGQYLLIPLPYENTAVGVESVLNEKSGEAPVPPSSSKPLPAAIGELEVNPSLLEDPKNSPASDTAIFAYPVNGKIIRDYVKNKTDGIDLSAPEGTEIVAAEKGIVAAITADTQEVPIIVLKHEGGLLTVYAGVGDIMVKEKEKVLRMQKLGKMRPGDPPYLHFEVRRGFESIDPMDLLN
jgi:murein DD-endopeptidase MepM/ murein hydrolase activator NlpD